MKKTLSVLLSLLLLCGVFTPAASALQEREISRSALPCIYIGGNGEDIVDRETGKVLYDFDLTKEQILEIAENVVPLLAAGYLTGDYEPYYKAFGEAFGKYYERVRLDENGNSQPGVGIPVADEQSNLRVKNRDCVSGGTYGLTDYNFNYDWRLSPLENADILADYIRCIRSATGKKVNLYTRCLGGNLVMAYLAKYPEEARENVASVGMDSIAGCGCEMIDNMFTGNMKLDGRAGARALDVYLEHTGGGWASNDMEDVIRILSATLDLLNEFYVADIITDDFQAHVYDVLATGLLREMIPASYGTWLGYWTMIPPEHLEQALNTVFGEEGSENRTRYAPLIEKIYQYNDEVAVNQMQILADAKAAGIHFAVISKYGSPLNFYCGESEKLSDFWVSVDYSSFGATTADIYTTLPDDYIAAAEANGTAKYIGPDKKIDASTCAFPDTTWFIKGCYHDIWTYYALDLCIDFFNANGTMTVFTDPQLPQYLVALETERSTDVVPMTAENQDADLFDVREEPTEKESKLQTVFRKLLVFFSFFRTLVSFLKVKFGK